MKNANDEVDPNISKELFEVGERKMLEIINSHETYKSKAKYFSIHCYVHEKIKYYKNHSNLINKEECLKMKALIDRILDENNKYLDELIWEYMHLLKQYNMLDLFSMNLGDAYFTALGSKQDMSINIDENDVLVDSY